MVQFVSIIIPAYNAQKTIKKCLNSIFAQTFRNFEVIVVNDGSRDNTAEILLEFQQKFQIPNSKFQIINQQNQGSNPARNRGVRETKGEFLLFCDADIAMKPQMLEKMVTALGKNLDKSFAYSSFYFGFKKFRLWPYDANRLRKIPYIHTTSLIRREHLPGFDEKIKKLQDWDLWLTMLEHGHTGVFIPEFLFKVYPSKHGISSWLPKFMYKLPWRKFGIKIKSLEKYRETEKIVRKKHKI